MAAHTRSKRTTIQLIAMVVALGGLLMGFDASVISGVVSFIEPEFGLSKLELGWSVASLTLTATLAMLVAGPLSDRFGRRTVLRWAALLYAVSAIGSAVAPDFITLVIARMVGGFGVGASLILAPMYIAEMAPPDIRGRLVYFNQLNIVVGISLAFFSNYLILQWAKTDGLAWVKALGMDRYEWRWMLGVEAIPAVIYYIGLQFVPRSPRWLVLKGFIDEAKVVLARLTSPEEAQTAIDEIHAAEQSGQKKSEASWKDLFMPSMRLVLTIGVVVAILQQITGINAVFFYAPMIFEQSGIGTDASFVQAILVGLTNLVFTVVAMLVIDRLGRKPLLSYGVAGIAVCMFVLSYGFYDASYTIAPETIELLGDASLSQELVGERFDDEGEFLAALSAVAGEALVKAHEGDLVKSGIEMNATLILLGILGFVASFAVSIGPVMWVLFSELFPTKIRGLAVSFVGLINSGVSFIVQWVFPWELDALGNVTTFFIYGLFAAVGLIFILRVIPETKGKSLEELEAQLIKT
jgi:SP family arabinose:H+ symporter-like MFS transporter